MSHPREKKAVKEYISPMSLMAADGSTVDTDQGYSHVVGKVQARGDGREVGTKTAEGAKKQT